MQRGELQTIEGWAGEVTHGGEQFSMYEPGDGTLEAYFPERANIDKPGKMIDAMLRLDVHPQWPKLRKKDDPDSGRPISQESALRIIYAMAIADALHEVTEQIKMRGVRPIEPHPKDEDAMWGVLLDEGQRTAVRLLRELERNEIGTEG